MSGTSIALSSVAVAQSSAALQAAERAEKIAKCTPVLQRPDLSTTAGRQNYATCVLVTEPLPSADMPQSVKITLFGAFVLMLLIATVYAWRERHSACSVGDLFMAWVCALMISFCVIAGLMLAIGFTYWVFA